MYIFSLCQVEKYVVIGQTFKPCLVDIYAWICLVYFENQAANAFKKIIMTLVHVLQHK